MKEVLIIIPAYNEAENIEKVVDNIIKNFPQYDYVVVNDNLESATNKVRNIIDVEKMKSHRNIDLIEEIKEEK